jgi:hypothetical protein
MAHRKLIREAADLITQAFRRLADAEHAEKELDLTFDDEHQRRAELASSLATATAEINVRLGQAVSKLREAQAEIMATNRRAFLIGTEVEQGKAPKGPSSTDTGAASSRQLEEARGFRDAALAKYKRGGSLHRALLTMREAGAVDYATSKKAPELGIRAGLLRTANDLGVVDAYGSRSDQYALNVASRLLLEAWEGGTPPARGLGPNAPRADRPSMRLAQSRRTGAAGGRDAYPRGTRVRYSGKAGGAPFVGEVLGPYMAGDADEVTVQRPDGVTMAIRVAYLERVDDEGADELAAIEADVIDIQAAARARDAGEPMPSSRPRPAAKRAPRPARGVEATQRVLVGKGKLERFIRERGLPTFPGRWHVVTSNPIELYAKGGAARHREEVYTAGAKPTKKDGKPWIDQFAWYLAVGQGPESEPFYLRIEKTVPERERLEVIREELTSSYSADFFPFILHRIDHQWDPGQTTVATAEAPAGVTTDSAGFWQWDRETPPPVYVGLPTTSRAGAHQTGGKIVRVNKTRSRIEVQEGRDITQYSWRKGATGYYEKGRSPRSSSRLGLGRAVDYLDPGV